MLEEKALMKDYGNESEITKGRLVMNWAVLINAGSHGHQHFIKVIVLDCPVHQLSTKGVILSHPSC